MRNTALRAGWFFGAVTLSGLVALGLAWYGVSGTFDVSDQVAFTVSGGAGGLGLTVAGSWFLLIHVGRVFAAREDAALDRVVSAASELAAAAHDSRAVGATETAPDAPAAGASPPLAQQVPSSGRSPKPRARAGRPIASTT